MAVSQGLPIEGEEQTGGEDIPIEGESNSPACQIFEKAHFG